MNVFERNGDVIGMSAVSDLVNGWPGGIIQANRHGVFVSPIFLVNQLYATQVGSDRLTATITGPTFDTTKEGKQVPVLDVSVTRSRDGRKIYINLVNMDPKTSIATNIKLNGVAVQQQAEIFTVQASEAAAANSFQTPQAISIHHSTINNSQIDLPKQSVSVVVLTVR